jgi:hypothetical protein
MMQPTTTQLSAILDELDTAIMENINNHGDPAEFTSMLARREIVARDLTRLTLNRSAVLVGRY